MLSVLSVCLSACITRKPHLRTSHQIFVHVACGRACSVRSLYDGDAILYVLPVLWMTSYFHIPVMALRRVVRIPKRRWNTTGITTVEIQPNFLDDKEREYSLCVAHRGRSLQSTIASLSVVAIVTIAIVGLAICLVIIFVGVGCARRLDDVDIHLYMYLGCCYKSSYLDFNYLIQIMLQTSNTIKTQFCTQTKIVTLTPSH